METFTSPKPFTDHPHFLYDRKKALHVLETEINQGSIDPPLVNLIRECMLITHFFTIQCCYGHFVSELVPEPENLISPSQFREKVQTVTYRLAYVVICLQNNKEGRKVYSDLLKMAEDCPDYIQFGSAEWFWERMVNTYCIQLEPDRLKLKDCGEISIEEAIFIDILRKDFLSG